VHVSAEHARNVVRDIYRDGEQDVARNDGRDEPAGRWVPLAQAVRELHVSRAAVYRRIRAGTLVSRPRGNRGLEVLVERDERDKDRDDRGRIANRSEDLSRDDRRDDGLAAARHALIQLEERLRVDDELRATLAEERAARARAEGELAAKDALVATLTAALGKAEARGDRLEAALVEARRPWLARLLEAVRRR
jgi:hypothetical protein